MSHQDRNADEPHQIVFYRSAGGDRHVQVLFRDESFWMPQKAIAELFGVRVPAISKHLSNIFESRELAEDSVVSVLKTTATDGKRYQTKHYSLDAIIAVGYRVNSYQATQFRIWATKTLKEFVIKGFVLDDERLKQGGRFGQDYFEELLERIREIRASERRFYQKVADIYALASDYDKDAPITKDFFATVQNKLHWAITGSTAAEIIQASVDASKPHMGLTTWKNAPDGKVLKSDVATAKNYLGEEQIRELNRIVSAYLDLAENRAQRRIAMTMADWSVFLENFLQLSDYSILQDKGKVSALEAKLKAEAEYHKFRVRQDREYISDFDREVKRLQGRAGGRSEPEEGDE
ncbi:MAG: cell filamentation protein Fic [Deltaproteobacteria bacterium]|nr:MAG: cell filamentation protein Fic [Deltaproteobacteria bacterium]